MKTLLTPLLLILVAELISSCTQKNEIETASEFKSDFEFNQDIDIDFDDEGTILGTILICNSLIGI